MPCGAIQLCTRLLPSPSRAATASVSPSSPRRAARAQASHIFAPLAAGCCRRSGCQLRPSPWLSFQGRQMAH
eukprot:4181137-Prymnesium_polylepis.1